MLVRVYGMEVAGKFGVGGMFLVRGKGLVSILEVLVPLRNLGEPMPVLYPACVEGHGRMIQQEAN